MSRIDIGAAVDAAHQHDLPRGAAQRVERQRAFAADKSGRGTEQRRDRLVLGQPGQIDVDHRARPADKGRVAIVSASVSADADAAP